MSNHTTRTTFAASLLMGVWLPATPSVAPQQPQTLTRLVNGTVAVQFAGRLASRPDGTAEIIGYCPSITSIGGTLFRGEPSEANAFFTVRSSPARPGTTIPNALLGHTWLTPLSGNAIRFELYYDRNPDQSYDRPETFSNGQKIATFTLPSALVTLAPSATTYVGTLSLEQSADFVFDSRRLNIKDLVEAITIHLFGTAPIVNTRTLTITVPFGATGVAVNDKPAKGGS